MESASVQNDRSSTGMSLSRIHLIERAGLPGLDLIDHHLADTEAPLCLASCSAEGHGAQLARLGASAGVARPGADELAGGGTRGDPAAPHATTRALIATASRVPDQPAEAGPDTP
jgi:hypothetical protein